MSASEIQPAQDFIDINSGMNTPSLDTQLHTQFVILTREHGEMSQMLNQLSVRCQQLSEELELAIKEIGVRDNLLKQTIERVERLEFELFQKNNKSKFT